LENISFHIESGEIVGFFGMVGSRRTELMHCLFGALPLDGGSINLDGKEVVSKHPRQAMAKGVYLCPEDRKAEGLVLDMSVSENCTLSFLGRFSRMGIIQKRDEKTAAEQLVRDLSIKTPSIDQKVVFLSGGNQQKVVIGKWMVGPEGRLIIFDEPTKGVDVGAKLEVYKIMQRIVQRSSGVIFVSSDLRELMGVADRIYVMRKGTIAGEFLRSEYDQHAILYAALTEDTTK